MFSHENCIESWGIDAFFVRKHTHIFVCMFSHEECINTGQTKNAEGFLCVKAYTLCVCFYTKNASRHSCVKTYTLCVCFYTGIASMHSCVETYTFCVCFLTENATRYSLCENIHTSRVYILTRRIHQGELLHTNKYKYTYKKYNYSEHE